MVSTEPQEELFGANFSFPYGHRSSVFVNESHFPHLLGCIINGIEEYVNPDIIITGHQSGLIPYYSGGIDQSKIATVSFLGGVKSDATILVTHLDDELNLVENTFKSLTYYFQLPILFVVLSNSKRQNLMNTSSKESINMIWEKTAGVLKEKFKVPVVDVMSTFYDKEIIETIEKFYS